MRTTLVTVRFARGLHARVAACLVQRLRKYRCDIILKAGHRVTRAGSILGLLLLAATVNTPLEIQASGEDEDAAVHAVETFFQADDEAALLPTAGEPLAGQSPEA